MITAFSHLPTRPHLKTQGEHGHLKPKGETSEGTCPAATLTLDFQTPNCARINSCCLSHPAHGPFLWQPQDTNAVLTPQPQRATFLAYSLTHGIKVKNSRGTNPLFVLLHPLYNPPLRQEIPFFHPQKYAVFTKSLPQTRHVIGQQTVSKHFFCRRKSTLQAQSCLDLSLLGSSNLHVVHPGPRISLTPE